MTFTMTSMVCCGTFVGGTLRAAGNIGSCVGSRGMNLLALNSTDGPCTIRVCVCGSMQTYTLLQSAITNYTTE